MMVIVTLMLGVLLRICVRYAYSTERKRRIILCFGAFSMVFTIILISGLSVFSVFVGLEVYPNINASVCSSALAYSTVVSLILFHVVLAVAVVISILGCIAWGCFKLSKATLCPERVP